MESFKAASTNPEFYSHSSFYFRGDDSDQNQTHFTDLGELEQSAAAFPHDDAVVLSPSSMFSLKANNVGGVPDSLHYGTLNVGGCLDIGSTVTETGGGGCVDTGQQQPYMYQQQKGTTTSGNGQFENWGDNSVMADNSQQTDTSTDVDTDDKNHVSPSLFLWSLFHEHMCLVDCYHTFSWESFYRLSGIENHLKFGILDYHPCCIKFVEFISFNGVCL